MGRLDALDLSLTLSRDEEEQRLRDGGDRLAQLRLALGGMLPFGDGVRRPGPPLCLVFEGWDASGKGGAIRRLTWPLDPRHVRHASYGAPTPEEHAHHFLWRFGGPLPGRGEMTIYDRSWYGRVLVERVEAITPEADWRRGYDEIVAFERSLVDDGMILAKFWMHVSDAEQLRRFEARANDPIKAYKLTPSDWENHARRGDYEAAVEEMLDRTDRPDAPWILVEGESKRWARVRVMEATIAIVERGMQRNGLIPPAPVRGRG